MRDAHLMHTETIVHPEGLLPLFDLEELWGEGNILMGKFVEIEMFGPPKSHFRQVKKN